MLARARRHLGRARTALGRVPAARPRRGAGERGVVVRRGHAAPPGARRPPREPLVPHRPGHRQGRVPPPGAPLMPGGRNGQDGLGRIARGLARRLRGPERPLTVTDRLDRWAARIVEFGIVDRAYLEAQTGRTFPTDAEAVSFYVHNDGRRAAVAQPARRTRSGCASTSPTPGCPGTTRSTRRGPSSSRPVRSSTPGCGRRRGRRVADRRPRSMPSATSCARRPTRPRSPCLPADAALHRRGPLRATSPSTNARAYAAAQHRTRRRYRQQWDGRAPTRRSRRSVAGPPAVTRNAPWCPSSCRCSGDPTS